MNKILLNLILFLLSYNINAQEKTLSDDSYFLVTSKGENYLYESPDYMTSKIDTIQPGEIIAVSGYNSNEIYLKGYRKGNEGYVSSLNFSINPDEAQYLKENKNTNNLRDSLAKTASHYLFQRWAEERLKEIRSELSIYENYKKIGLIITDKKFAFAEYGSQFGLKLSFYNGYKKDIKYIDITVRPYNRVGDKTYDDLGRDVARVQVIGPLESDMNSSVEFDSMFWDDRDIITYLLITYMKVTFMDGSVKEIKDVNKHLAKDVYNGK
ncbi:MAG: hypothetical protein RSD92_07235 [Erysipelotrichaceae bacterium]